MKAPPQGQSLCVHCGNATVATIDSRVMASNWRMRRKRCTSCEHRWTTYEVPAEMLDNFKYILETMRLMGNHVHAIGLLLEQTRHLSMIQEGKDANSKQSTTKADAWHSIRQHQAD